MLPTPYHIGLIHLSYNCFQISYSTTVKTGLNAAALFTANYKKQSLKLSFLYLIREESFCFGSKDYIFFNGD